MQVVKLKSGYSIREMTAEEFFPKFSKIYDSLFGDDHTFFPDSHFTAQEKTQMAQLKDRMGTPLDLNLGLFSPAGKFVGFSFGFQESEYHFAMMASAVLPAHRGKGLYTDMVKHTIQWATKMGFQTIGGTHCATNNPVLITKLKLGFVFSKVELSDVFGTILHLHYFTNPLRRKVMDYRSGLRVPDSQIKSVMKFNRLDNKKKKKARKA